MSLELPDAARLDRLEVLVAREFDRREHLMRLWRARYYLRCAFTRPSPGLWRPPSRPRFGGLALEVYGEFIVRRYGTRKAKKVVLWSEAARSFTPFGWRWEFVYDSDSVLIMPAWLAYPRRWWALAWCRFRRWQRRRR